MNHAPVTRRPDGGDDWVERVRAASDIVELVGQTVKLRRVGHNWVGLCPFHKEKTPSFSVHAERQFYHCFSCKAGGDVFKFVQETEKVGFMEAVEMLSRRAGIAVPDLRAHGGVERSRRTRVLEALDAAAAAYEQWLADPTLGAAARAYLERRGLSREMVREFRLGLAPAGWEHVAQRLGPKHGEDALIEAGLVVRRQGAREGAPGRGGVYDRFRNRLMVPLVAPGGAVVGFGARALDEADAPKYLNSPETVVYHKGAFLFGLDVARKHTESGGELTVVEGYFDALALHQAGFRNTVATSGTALTVEQARALHRVAARVALTYDGDAAGQDAMMRSLGVLLGEGLDVVVVDLPKDEDPDTLLRAHGAAGWEAARRSACDPVEFIQRHVLRTRERAANGAGDPREIALQAWVTLGTEVKDPIRLRLLVERASQVFGLGEHVLARAVALKRSGHTGDQPLQRAVSAQRQSVQFVERKLLQLLLQHPEGLAEVRADLGPEDFRDPACDAVARWLWAGGEGLPEDEGAAELVRELSTTEGSDEPDWRGELQLERRLMVKRRLQGLQRDRQQRLAKVAGPDEEKKLLEELDHLARSLRDLST